MELTVPMRARYGRGVNDCHSGTVIPASLNHAARAANIGLKVGIVPVAIRQDRIAQWPIEAEDGIVPAHATTGVRLVELTDLIEDLGIIGPRLKAMRTALGNVKHVTVLTREFRSEPLPVRR